MVEKTELFAAISNRANEIRSYPNACAFTDRLQEELNALIVYARANFADYDDTAPQFSRFATRKEAETMARDTKLIEKLVLTTKK